MSLVGRKAPDFCAGAVLGRGEIRDNFRLSEAIKDKKAILFFYPLDFTFVCPTELISLDHAFSAFKERGVELISVSIDSVFTHCAWRDTPVEKGGIGPVQYTMVADINHAICQSYGVEHPEKSVALRAAFLIDAQGVVRSEIVNDLPLGRSIEELMRLVDALDFTEKHGEVCPAGWKKGAKGFKPTAEGVAEFLKNEGNKL